MGVCEQGTIWGDRNQKRVRKRDTGTCAMDNPKTPAMRQKTRCSTRMRVGFRALSISPPLPVTLYPQPPALALLSPSARASTRDPMHTLQAHARRFSAATVSPPLFAGTLYPQPPTLARSLLLRVRRCGAPPPGPVSLCETVFKQLAAVTRSHFFCLVSFSWLKTCPCSELSNSCFFSTYGLHRLGRVLGKRPKAVGCGILKDKMAVQAPLPVMRAFSQTCTESHEDREL